MRLLYDDKAIYVGVICYDADPSRIVTTDSRRDSGLDAMDSFQMIFDTYHDRQNGFIFGTNAAGHRSTTRRCGTRARRCAAARPAVSAAATPADRAPASTSTGTAAGR